MRKRRCDPMFKIVLENKITCSHIIISDGLTVIWSLTFKNRPQSSWWQSNNITMEDGRHFNIVLAGKEFQVAFNDIDGFQEPMATDRTCNAPRGVLLFSQYISDLNKTIKIYERHLIDVDGHVFGLPYHCTSVCRHAQGIVLGFNNGRVAFLPTCVAI